MTRYILAGLALAILTNQPGAPHGTTGVVMGFAIVFAPLLFWAAKLAVEGVLLGWGASYGARAAGLFRQPCAPRRRILSARAGLADTSAISPPPRYRRGDRYQPWPGEGDDWPTNLPPADRPRLPPK